MTSKLNRLILFAALALLGALKPAHAWMWQEVPEKTMTVRYRLSVAANSSTAAVVIDLSNTVNWPHKQTGQINISSFRLELDKAAASTTTVKIGVMNYVDTSSGSVTWFYAKENGLNASNTGNVDPLAFQPNFIQCKIQPSTITATSGATPYMLSNDTTSLSTTYQTDVVLPTPFGNAAPGFGDIVMSVSNGTAIVVVEIEIQYHSLN